MGGLKNLRRKNMKLITTSELMKRSESELKYIFSIVSQNLAKTNPETPERRNALASLENISHAIAVKYVKRPGF
jgi:hypothetical protein